MAEVTYQMRRHKPINEAVLRSIRRYVRSVQDSIPVEAAILYGSHASGNQGPESDIDLAIVSSRFKDFAKDMATLIRKKYDIDRRIEPLAVTPEDLNHPEPGSIFEEINRYGQVVYPEPKEGSDLD